MSRYRLLPNTWKRENLKRTFQSLSWIDIPCLVFMAPIILLVDLFMCATCRVVGHRWDSLVPLWCSRCDAHREKVEP